VYLHEFAVGQVTEYYGLGVGDTSVAQQEHKVGEGWWNVFGNARHFCASYRSSVRLPCFTGHLVGFIYLFLQHGI